MHSLDQILHKRMLVSATPDENVLAVARRMVSSDVGAVVVVAAGNVAGIFGGAFLFPRLVVALPQPPPTTVGEVMTREVVTAQLHDRTGTCEEKMRRAACRHLPVLAGGRVIAMLSMRDLLQDDLEEQVAENQLLRAYIYQTPLVRP